MYTFHVSTVQGSDDNILAHFNVARGDFWNTKFAKCCIGRAGPIAWPSRSPHENSIDFFLWKRKYRISNALKMRKFFDNVSNAVFSQSTGLLQFFAV